MIMKIKIEPRKYSDRGGYLAMPLKSNIPNGKEGWILTTCKLCGSECWDRPLPEGYEVSMFAGKCCTMCALKKGME